MERKKCTLIFFGCTPCITNIYRNLILKQTDWDGTNYRTIFLEPLDCQILLHKTGISKYSLIKGYKLLTDFNWAGVESGSPHSQHSSSLLSVYQRPATLGMTRSWKYCKPKTGDDIFKSLVPVFIGCSRYLLIHILEWSTNTRFKPQLYKTWARIRILILQMLIKLGEGATHRQKYECT